MTTNNQEQNDPNEEILRIARQRFKLGVEASKDNRTLGLEDTKFAAGEQWPQAVLNDREADGRPCLTINRIPQFVRQITNDQRQNRPQIKVKPVDDKADVETAKIYQGIIRNIEQGSNAEIAYDTATEGAAIAGFGFFRIITDYLSPISFDQEIKIKAIRNQFTVLLDPHSKEPDGSDANWAFVFEEMPKEDFIAEYGESKLAKHEAWSDLETETEGWVTDSTVKVAEYFYKHYEQKDLVLLSNGETYLKEQLDLENLDPSITIKAERKASIPQVKWVKLNGFEELGSRDWAGQWIPIIPVYGNIVDINGKVTYEGVVRHAKDSQRMYNYWCSTETETITLAPKAPYIAAEGQIPPEYESMWALANRKNFPYLVFKPVTLAGQVLNAPQRQTFEPAVQAITQARMGASEDMKATTGIYDAALGARGNESSGVAIQRRNNQSQTSNFHFFDNLTRSMRHAGRILVDLIPKIYDTARVARIIGEDGEEQIVKINEAFMKDGKQVEYNLSAGKYDVVIETGPSFATKRQEAAMAMSEMAAQNPAVMGIAGDLLFKNMDWPGSAELAERWKKTIDPKLLGDDQQQMQLPPEVQAQLQQMDQLIGKLHADLEEAEDKLKTKREELLSRERIELAKLETQTKLKLIEMSHQAALPGLERDLADIDQQQAILNNRAQLFEQQYQNQNFNDLGPMGSADQQNQQIPTDGFSSGQFMEE